MAPYESSFVPAEFDQLGGLIITSDASVDEADVVATSAGLGGTESADTLEILRRGSCFAGQVCLCEVLFHFLLTRALGASLKRGNAMGQSIYCPSC